MAGKHKDHNTAKATRTIVEANGGKITALPEAMRVLTDPADTGEDAAQEL